MSEERRITAADFTSMSATAEDLQAIVERVAALETRIRELEAERDLRRDYEIDRQEREG